MDSTNNIDQNHNKDYRTNILDNYQCDEYIFCSNFDSGNLGKVELVKKCPETEFGENIVHVEFNVWTTPDCYGTSYESPNRTWFFFSIKGGRPYRNIKINVKNLNRQSKLFSQGMQPVIRIGHFGKWERIKNKPTYYVEEENFSMSFIHQPMDKCDIEHFYAFTYPFTYSECQTMLEKFDKKYLKNLNEINFIINKLNNTENEETTTSRTTMVTIITSKRTIRKISNESYDKNCISDKIIENDSDLIKECNMDGTDNPIMPSTTTTAATSSIEAFKEITKTELQLPYEKLTRKQLLNEIYYHRETLINSLEGRRIDLLTITSFHGIQNIREERLSNLFPDRDCSRCHTFKDKKIIFMSSRVHPGETPASFVLNGFLNLILDKKSTIANSLRQLYVFKIVPILNPDGVYRGFYRTDTLGQNLNRMYVNPKLEIHPSIYAVKKLIKYYHFGFDSCDTSENSNEEVSSSSSTSSRSIDLPIKSNDEIEQQSNESNSNEIEEPLVVEIKLESQSCSLKESTTVTTTTLSSSSSSSSSSEIEENQKSTILNRFPETTPAPTLPTIEIKTQKTFTETLIPEIKTHVANDETPIKTMNTIKLKKSSTSSGNNNNNNNRSENKVKKITIKTMLAGHHYQSHVGTHNLYRNTENKLKNNSLSVVQQQQQQQLRSHNKRINIRKDTKTSNTTKSHTLISSGSNRSLNNKRNILSNHNINNSGTASTTNLDFTMMKKMNTVKGGGNSESGNGNNGEENPNMFLYIDFHGHASKKGVFMYGNHFSNSAEAVECMLLPRLMSINSHHFHYDACNFSERNMYRREKRDGLSKEGSGRVAIFKMTGLIKSYTLECNYNTGRYINNLPARGKDINSNHSTKTINLTPPKYTPAIYEDVGRALGPSILDITNSNTLSRIHNSEFRTIQGLRITLRNEIEKGFTNSHRNQTSSSATTATNASVVTTSKALNAHQNVIKRIKRNARSASSALPQNDTSKENKVLYSMSWDTTNPSTSMLIKSQTVVGTQSKQLKIKLQRNSVNGNGNGGNGNNTNKKSNHLIRVRSNSAPIYGVAGCSKEFKKKSTKALIESPSSNSSCVVTSFFIPPKKVKVSNKNTIFKGNMMKSIIPLPPPMPPPLQQPPPPPLLLQSSSSALSSLMQNKVNNTNNCLNCDLNNQICQTDNHYHASSASYCCKNSLSADEIQNQMMPSCSNVVTAATATVDNNSAIAVPSSSSSSSSKLFTHTASCSQSTSAIPISLNSFRKGKKIELLPSSSSSSSTAVNLFKIKNNPIRARSAAARLTNISSNNEKHLNLIKMKSFSNSARKKRTIRHEIIIIKRKKNKLKSAIH